MYERARAQRFALGGKRWRRWNDVHVRAVSDDFFLRNRWRQFVFEPVEAHALRGSNSIEHALIRHRTPAKREIDRHERGLAVVAIGFSMQNAGVQREMGERFQIEVAASNW